MRRRYSGRFRDPVKRAAAAAGHRIRWYFYEEPGHVLVPVPRGLSARGFGFEARCACGWHTRTGGGTRGYVRQLVEDHKYDAAGAAYASWVVSGVGPPPY